MTIRELRILPPFAIGRLGSADDPVDNFHIEVDPRQPLGFRAIVPERTLVVSEATGELEEKPPSEITFKSGGKIRPVAPFLELFALVSEPGAEDVLKPVDVPMLQSLGVGVASIEWRVHVANRKIVRRTGDQSDLIAADTGWFSTHSRSRLEGHSQNFISSDSFVDFGNVRFIRPTADFPEIRLRFTPAQGLIYGSNAAEEDSPIPPERRIYDQTKGWYNFGTDDVENETVPPSLYAIKPPAPSWLYNNVAISRGYLDDACDGVVEVRLNFPDREPLQAAARICAAPPAVVPDSLFVRSLADDLEQVVFGPQVDGAEAPDVTRARAMDIVRRAYETVRFMNVHVMNGNDIGGRAALSLDSMPEEEAADTERAIRPVMAPGSVDTLAIMALHQHVYAALQGGSAPWFVNLLRKPDEVADFTDRGRRKMPALMCGADNSYLALTWRQIDTITQAANHARSVPAPALTPLNNTAQKRMAAINHKAAGNPISSRPETSVANCCPGLEVDFRAVWRRMFKGIVLREYDNLVVEIDPGVTDPAILALQGRRLLQIRVPGRQDPIPTTTEIWGPASSDPNGEIRLTTQFNRHGLAPLEWSNALAFILKDFQGKRVTCDFSSQGTKAKPASLVPVPADGEEPVISIDFEVRTFFEGETAVISRDLAGDGELTQGLCSPWQNDYRECSCYYWASARPDYVNIEPAGNGLSQGDNWFQKKRTGDYVPDDYADTRLVLYNELFHEWEHWLRFQVGGRDLADDDGVSEAAGIS